jgi:Tfp pilus assembly protein PilW
LIEFMIAAAITTAVLGGTFAIATQMQQSYSTQFEDVAAEQEARYALEWISRALRSAGSNPYGIVTAECPAANTAFQALRLDPNGNGIQDDVRIQADTNPPNGLLVGLGGAGGCTAETGEDVTIAHDATSRVITRLDNAVGGAPEAMTDSIFTELRFTYLDSARIATTMPTSIAFAQVSVTAQSRARIPGTAQFASRTLQTEVRLRAQ